MIYFIKKNENATGTTINNAINNGVVQNGAADQYWDSADIQHIVNNTGWTVSGGNKVTGGSQQLVSAGKVVEFASSSDNLTINQNYDATAGKTTFTFGVNPNATFNSWALTVNGGNSNNGNEPRNLVNSGNIKASYHDKDETVNGVAYKKGDISYDLAPVVNIGDTNTITIDGDKNNITFNQTGGGSINNLTSHINPDGSRVGSGDENEAATVQDVLNSGFYLKAGGQDVDFVQHGDTVNFKSSNNTINVTAVPNATNGEVDLNIAVNVPAVQKNLDPITFYGDSGSFDRRLGQTVNVVGADDNISVEASGNTLRIKVADDLKVDSIQTGDTIVNNEGVTINNGNQRPVSLTQNGLDNGGNRITNVGNGVQPNDAANVGQLQGVEGRANAGTAQALATAGLPHAYLPGKNMVSVGGGVYRGEAGYAVGFSSVSDNGAWVFQATGSGNSKGNFGGSVGMGFQW